MCWRKKVATSGEMGVSQLVVTLSVGVGGRRSVALWGVLLIEEVLATVHCCRGSNAVSGSETRGEESGMEGVIREGEDGVVELVWRVAVADGCLVHFYAVKDCGCVVGFQDGKKRKGSRLFADQRHAVGVG